MTTRVSIRTILRRTGVLLGTAATAALAVGLVSVGSGVIAARADGAPGARDAAAIHVETARVAMEDGFTVLRAFVGQVEPPQSVELGFEQGGTVAEMLVEEGEAVAAGQVLARLDTRTLEADRRARVAAREALVAQAELAQLTTGRRQALEERGFAATQGLDEARLRLAETQARIAEVDAALEGLDVALDKAVLRAPFAGRVGARQADTGRMLAPGQPALTLLEGGAETLRVGVPPELAGTLTPGLRIEAVIEGRAVPAVLESVRPDIDPATRTRAALFRLEASGAAFGQTGEVALPRHVAARGAWLPVGALAEGERGLWSVMTVSADGTVAREAVEVVHADAERAYVRGSLAGGAEVIVSGPHRVIPGQSVVRAGS